MKRTLFTLLLLSCLGSVPTIQAENTGAQGEAAAKYTSQTYVDTLKAEVARFQVRLTKQTDANFKQPLEVAIADGGKLLVIVQGLIQSKRSLDSAEFLSAAATYLRAKQAVPISWDDEIAHYSAWIETNKSDTAQAPAVKYYEQILVLLKRGKEAADKNNKMAAVNAQKQFNQYASTANSYHKNGSYKGLGPDTHKGEYILVWLQSDPNVTIQNVEPTRRRRVRR